MGFRPPPSRVPRILPALALLALPLTLGAQAGRSARNGSTDSAAVADALHRFLTAFENLDWEPFRAAFSDSATVFYPAAAIPKRVTGRAAVDSTFLAVFAEVRRNAVGGPPYQQLVPVDLRIESLAPGVVLATFELHNAERLGRRTVVFRQESAGWRIVHLHASNLAVSPPR